VEPYRERIEDFMRRYGYEGNRVLRVLMVAVAILLALLVLRRLRVLAVPVLVGAMLVVGGWLLLSSLTTRGLIAPIPRLSSEGPVVRNVFVWACGRKVPAEHRAFARGMRKDCGIYGD